MFPLAQILCLCLSVAGAPSPQVSRPAGGIWYTHEILNRDDHLLRISTTTSILDSNENRQSRMAAFAEQFARETCANRFRLADSDRPRWPRIRPVYAKQFVFRCR
jgi:hypothetical protein